MFVHLADIYQQPDAIARALDIYQQPDAIVRFLAAMPWLHVAQLLHLVF